MSSRLRFGFRAQLSALALVVSTTAANPAAAQQSHGVRIARDVHGVAHILAKTDASAYFGAGYAAAEDRLFQRCWMRLVVQGRAAEFFGPGNVVNAQTGAIKKTYVVSDRKSRMLGWSRHAAKVVAAMPAPTLAL